MLSFFRYTIKYLIILWIFFANVSAKEFRLGLMQHDLNGKFKQSYEKGQNILVEILFDKNANLFNLNPHIGVSINNNGYTSNFFAGLTFRRELNKYKFFEISLGGSLNNAAKNKYSQKKALGSNLMFRESVSFGFNISDNYNIAIIVDHISNADLASVNPGITDFGIKFGCKF